MKILGVFQINIILMFDLYVWKQTQKILETIHIRMYVKNAYLIILAYAKCNAC